MTARLCFLAAASLVLLAGCTSPLPDAGLQTAMHSAIGTYNSSRPTSLAGTGTACATAADTLRSASANANARVPKPERPRHAQLVRAYQTALAGFEDCSRAASTDSYPLMIRAGDELAHATHQLGGTGTT